MKRLFVCAVALGLFAAVPAVAASGNDHHGDKHDAATHGTKFHGESGATHHNLSGGTMTSHTHFTETGGSTSHNALAVKSFSGGTKTHMIHTGTGGATSHNVLSGNAALSNNSRRFGKSSGHNANILSLRLNVQSPNHFHNGYYRAPEGYQARHWGYGDRLPGGYYARNYWIGDFLTFGLFAPPDGLVWVRVGDDALLIDENTGEVIQVRYGVFY